MTKTETKKFLQWLVDLKELNKTDEEINELANRYAALFDTYDYSHLPMDWQPIIKEWIEHKINKKQKYKTQKQFNIFVKHLVELSQGNLRIATAIIQKSIANNYSGIFQLSKNDKPIINNEQQQLNETAQKYFG